MLRRNGPVVKSVESVNNCWIWPTVTKKQMLKCPQVAVV